MLGDGQRRFDGFGFQRAESPVEFVARAVEEDESGDDLKVPARAEFAPDGRADVEADDLQLTAQVLFEPVHDRPGREAGGSIVGVELDEDGLAVTDGGFDLRGGLIGARAGAEEEPREYQRTADRRERQPIPAGETIAQKKEREPADDDQRRDNKGMLVDKGGHGNGLFKEQQFLPQFI